MSALTGGTRAHHINFRNKGGKHGLIARGAAWTAPGGHTHQREGSKVMLVCFMCDSGCRAEKPGVCCMTGLAVPQPELLLATANISAFPRH